MKKMQLKIQIKFDYEHKTKCVTFHLLGHVLPPGWHVKAHPEPAHRRPLPVQGGRQASAGILLFIRDLKQGLQKKSTLI